MTTPKPPAPCGFCATGHHGLCPGTIRNGSSAPKPTWTCPCHEKGHTLGGAHRDVEIVRVTTPARVAPREPSETAAPAPGALPPARGRVRKPAFAFPEGVCSPYQFRAVLIERGLVAADFRPQTVYTWVTKARRDGTFPVRYYAAGGSESKAGEPGVKPGVPVDEAVAWFEVEGSRPPE